MDDQVVLKALQKLDQQALIDVFDQYAPKLFSYAYHLSGDPVEADDIVAEVFKKLLEHLKSGRGPRHNLRSYLYQVAYHEIVDKVRSGKHITDLSDDLPAKPEETPPERQQVNEETASLLSAMTKHLSDDQRHVIHLRFFDDLSIDETATILGKSQANIKVIQNRAVNKLRLVMEQET
jgi:RNA polymerase sigma-70 factor, ECF subfamily